MQKLENEMNRIVQKWVVDPTADANGDYVIRVDDGTMTGQSVATVYGLAVALTIVEEHNNTFKGA